MAMRRNPVARAMALTARRRVIPDKREQLRAEAQRREGGGDEVGGPADG